MADGTELIASSARNLADWHEASLKPLGIDSRRANGLWYQLQKGPVIYVSAVTLAPARDSPDQMTEIEKIASMSCNTSCVIIDSWAELDLTHLGFRRSDLESWYVRPAGPMPEHTAPPDLVIEDVKDAEGLKEFEIATWDGFESGPELRAAGTGGQHHPGTLDDQRMHYFLGRLDGEAVTSAIAHVSDDIVGVFGVSTLPDYRKCGFGEAVTWAATMTAPHLPAHLEPSPMGASMYRKMGYDEIGNHVFWHRFRA